MVLPFKQHTNDIDSGLYTLAFIVYLLENDKYPTEVSFDQSQIQTYLLKWFESNQISGSPISSSKKDKRN